MQPLVQSLESRRLLSADISVALASKTLADSLVAGAALKSPSVSYTVSASNGTLTKTEGKAKLTLTVSLQPVGGGAAIATGSAKITASALAKKPATAKIAFSKLKVAPAVGSYQLVATLSGQTAVSDSNTANDTATTAIAVTAPNDGSSTTPFSGSQFQGNVLTFKGKKVGFGGTNRETGTFTANNGATGQYSFTFGTGSTDASGVIEPASGSGAPFTLVFHANKGKVTGLSGKKITFGVTQAQSSGYVDYAGGRVYYK